MKYISVQMIDLSISSSWWKELVKCFIKENDTLQIRCWNEEAEEISMALRYGTLHVERNETCIDGLVSADFIQELLDSTEPEDKSVYNKMTQYFTIHVSDGEKIFESSHYGTELYLVLSEEDINCFKEIMKTYEESFSIFIGEA